MTRQDWFLNTVVEIETTLTSRQLLTQLKDIEKNLRENPPCAGGRTIDLIYCSMAATGLNATTWLSPIHA